MSELVKKDISKPLAVITGATGGLGEIFARLLAQRGFDLLLVGRNREKLESLAALLNKNFKVSASPIVSDLSSETELRKLCTFLKTLPQTPHVLINNAGFGFVGNALSMAPEKAQEMINVNVKALTALTLALAPQMKEKGVGRILNVASIAAFMPCPTMAVYASTKAYVLSFSEALNTELKGTGVTVSALCPGPLATAFWDRAGLESAYSLNTWMTSTESAAQAGIDALFSGTPVTTPGIANRLLTVTTCVAPRSWTRYITHLWLKKFLNQKCGAIS